jgi:hypothetical protein
MRKKALPEVRVIGGKKKWEELSRQTTMALPSLWSDVWLGEPGQQAFSAAGMV